MAFRRHRHRFSTWCDIQLEPIYELEVDKVLGAASVEKCNHITTVYFDGLFGYMKTMFTHRFEQHCCQTRIFMMSVDHVDTRFLFRFRATYFGKMSNFTAPITCAITRRTCRSNVPPSPAKETNLGCCSENGRIIC
ncbi:hypothetical protein GJ496_003197 [Pomphorhynchus laevis]|nr:hypothetical protein GJ496_003197 [Pomphorhynchus laevis]